MSHTQKFRIISVAMATLLATAACIQSTEEPAAPVPATDSTTATPATATAAQPAAPATNWVGRWPGPEGTYLAISAEGEGYRIELANLDEPKVYSGKLEGDAIVFERDGKTESIRATNGTGTGMKYYGDDRTDCLVITKGAEGFCRG